MTEKNTKSNDKKIIKRWKLKKDFSEALKHSRNKSVFSLYQVVTIAILTSLFSLVMGMAITSANVDSKTEAYSDDIQEFVDEYLNIKDSYYEDMNDDEYMKIALEAILNSLDDYSAVVDDSLSNNLTTKLQGTYQGFGIEIVADNDGNIYIVGIVDDSPAEAAGLQVYDIIRKMNDIDVTGLTTTEFVNMVKESKETTFDLVIERNGTIVNVVLERKLVTLKSVASATYSRNDKKIGYIYVSLFAYNTDVQFEEELKKLESQGIDSLIVDLRYNTGGHLTAVENMMSLFLNKSHVIYQIETKKETIKHYSNSDETRSYDVAILVNGTSASASEMFAATMQEQYGATVIGTTTFGKGTVQEVQDSTSSDVQYKLTTKKWLTPKGNWINGVGVKPDIEVELNVKDELSFTEEEDNQLQTAINLLAEKH